MLNVVLVEPEIPPNTGNVARLCLATETTLHLVKPLGFTITDKQLRRAGLDYWQHVHIVYHESLQAFLDSLPSSAQCWLLTTKTERPYWQAPFQPGDYLIFGRETKGLPTSLLKDKPECCLTIPMTGQHARSLNLATSVGIVLYEGIRQINGRDVS